MQKSTLTLTLTLILLLLLVVLIVTVVCQFRRSHKYDLVVAAPFKNEAHILKEWVEHYFFHGIDHIYLINDGSTDNFEEVLAPFIRRGYVTLLHQTAKIDTYPRQKKVYQNLLSPRLHESRWWVILDLDEFWYCPESVNVKKAFLDTYDTRRDVAQVCIPWVMFGSSGHIEQPSLVVPNFLWCKGGVEKSVKSVFRSDKLVDFDVHSHSVRGKTIRDERFLINHYAIQSWKFFERVKMTRGDVNLYAQTVGVVRDRAYFDRYDFHEKIDDRLARQNKSA